MLDPCLIGTEDEGANPYLVGSEGGDELACSSDPAIHVDGVHRPFDEGVADIQYLKYAAMAKEYRAKETDLLELKKLFVNGQHQYLMKTLRTFRGSLSKEAKTEGSVAVAIVEAELKLNEMCLLYLMCNKHFKAIKNKQTFPGKFNVDSGVAFLWPGNVQGTPIEKWLRKEIERRVDEVIASHRTEIADFKMRSHPADFMYIMIKHNKREVTIKDRKMMTSLGLKSGRLYHNYKTMIRNEQQPSTARSSNPRPKHDTDDKASTMSHSSTDSQGSTRSAATRRTSQSGSPNPSKATAPAPAQRKAKSWFEDLVHHVTPWAAKDRLRNPYVVAFPVRRAQDLLLARCAENSSTATGMRALSSSTCSERSM